MADEQALLRLGDALRVWAPPLQALAVILGLPAVAFYARRIAKHAGESAHLAAATAEAAEAAKVSAITSLQTLQELQAARQAEVAPYVIAYLDITEERRVCVVVKNIGRLPARDVAIGFDPPLTDVGPGSGPWETPAFLSESIPFLPPQYELRSDLGDSGDLLVDEHAPAREYQTHITYTDASTHGTHTDSYTLDLGVFRNVRLPHATTMSEVHGLMQVLSDEQKTVLEGLAAVQARLAQPSIATEAEAISNVDQAPSEAATEIEELIAEDKGAVDGEPPVKGESAAEVEAPTPRASMQPAKLLATLCEQWRLLGQRQRWESAGSLQRSLREIIRAVCEDDVEGGDGVAVAHELLNPILAHRFYLDGGESLRQFELAVDTFLSAEAPA